MSILTAFNNHFLEFLEDVHMIFPEDRNIKKAKTALEMMKKANPRLIISVWKEYITDIYKDRIERNDISFFLSKDYSQDIRNLGDTSKILEMIEKLRDPIRNMGETNQQKTMEYIRNLTKLSILYYQQN